MMSCWCKKLWLTLYCRWPWVQMMQSNVNALTSGRRWRVVQELSLLSLSLRHTLRVCSSPVLISVSNNMSLSFQSDARLADRGFSATWEAVYPEDLSGKTPCKLIKTSIHSHLHINTARMNPADAAVSQQPSVTLCVLWDFLCVCPLWIFWSQGNEGRIAMQNNRRKQCHKRTGNII